MNSTAKKTREARGKPVEVRVAGRVMLKRSAMGKAAFLTIQDLSGRIQLYVSKNGAGEVHPRRAQATCGISATSLARGTVVQDEGRRTHGQAASEARLLTKSLRPLPDKFHGLTDQETKYRQRYLDLIMNEESRFTFVARSRLVQSIRNRHDRATASSRSRRR